MKKFLIIDLEATCAEGKERENYRRASESIELGWVVVNPLYEIEKEGDELIKPVRNPILTKFCTTLTGIAQSDIDLAPTFPFIMERLKGYLGGNLQSNYILGSWGDYDNAQLIRDCAFHSYSYPFGLYINLKNVFAIKRKIVPCGLQKALEICGLTFEGQPHCGLDDAKNVVRIVKQEKLIDLIQINL
jgi:inhibitor of KinA sporulation pathway (predicted exonuclease)